MSSPPTTPQVRAPSIFRSLWEGEVQPISERYRVVATVLLITFAVGFSLGYLGLLQYTAYLGPGLGDDWDIGPLATLFRQLGSGTTLESAWLDPTLAQVALFLLVVANLLATAGITAAGYLRFERVFGRPFPIRSFLVFFSLNAINALSITGTLGAIGAIGWMLGFEFSDAYNAFGAVLLRCRTLAMQVPTLVDVPGWLAFLLVYNVGGFVHYWAHRMGHESRLLWLLFHRQHHMTPELIQPTSQAVFFAFPLFLVLAVPYVIVFTLIAKLFTHDLVAVATYTVVYKLVSAGATTFSHQSALYDVARKSTFIRALGILVSEGPYHYLHHSADDGENTERGNLVNIGGGMGFVWDRVFGTFRPLTERRPAVGLHGSPELYMNPLRLAFAGLAQLVYELRNNPGLGAKLRVLALGSDYVPPNSRDFAIKDPNSTAGPAT